MNAAFLIAARWAHRHWSRLVMCIATMAGIGVGLVVVHALGPATDLAVNLTVGACMVAVQSVMYSLLVRSNQAVMPPRVLMWAVGLTSVAILLLIL
jgi:hypothetical protein